MSFPPDPSPPPVVVDSPLRPTPYVQCPAVTITVALSWVAEQLNQPPGSSKRESMKSASKKISSPTYGCSPLSGWPLVIADAGAASRIMDTIATSAENLRISPPNGCGLVPSYERVGSTDMRPSAYLECTRWATRRIT